MNGYQLKAARKALGRTQASMAAFIGCSKSTWERWESGQTRPSPAYKEKIRQLLRYAGRKNDQNSD